MHGSDENRQRWPFIQSHQGVVYCCTIDTSSPIKNILIVARDCCMQVQGFKCAVTRERESAFKTEAAKLRGLLAIVFISEDESSW
jgi:hypothetical protein